MKTILLALCAWCASAATVTIDDTLRYPFNGQLATCTLTLTGQSIGTTNGTSTFTPYRGSYSVVSGVVHFTLESNDSQTPAGTSYSVRYQCTQGTPYTETWVVPSDPSTTTIRAVRTSVPPSPGLSMNYSQLVGGQPGDLMYFDAASKVQRLAVGTEGYCLKVVSGLPTWVSSCGSGGSSFDDFTGAFDSYAGSFDSAH